VHEERVVPMPGGPRYPVQQADRWGDAHRNDTRTRTRTRTCIFFFFHSNFCSSRKGKEREEKGKNKKYFMYVIKGGEGLFCGGGKEEGRWRLGGSL
jgi:hypothetical protein